MTQQQLEQFWLKYFERIKVKHPDLNMFTPYMRLYTQLQELKDE